MSIALVGTGGLNRATIPDYTAAYTIAGWVNLTALEFRTIFSVANASTSAKDELFLHGADGFLCMDADDDGAFVLSWLGDVAQPSATWMHLAMVRTSASTVRVVKNGVQLSTSTGSFGTKTTGDRFDIGQNLVAGSRIQAKFADVRVWTAALTDAELLTEALSSTVVRTANLWADWTLPDNSTLTDGSGNGRTLTANGTVNTDGAEPPYSFPITFDAAAEVERTGTTTPQTWTHTPVAVPRAVVVAVVHGTSTTDHISAVSYGGVALTRKVRATDTVTELGAAELWFLGAGIPTGAQTVSATCGSTTDDIHFVSMTFTAGCDTEVVDTDSIGANQANPSVTLNYGGRTCLAVAALYGGGAAPSDFAPNANCTTVHEFDLGAFYSDVIRQTSAGSADFAIGGTSATDDVAYVALAIRGSVSPGKGALTLAGLAPTVSVAGGGTTVTPGVGALVLAGLAATVVVTAHVTVTPGVGALTVAGLAPTVAVSNHQTVTPGVGALTLAGLAPAATVNTNISPAVGALTLAGLAPTVTASNHQTVTPGVGALSLSGLAPLALAPRTVTPGLGAITVAGLAPTAAVSAHQTVTPGVGALVLAGLAPTAVAANHQTVTPAPGALSLTGLAPTVAVTAHTTVTPDAGVLSLAGLAPTVSITAHQTATPGTGALTLAGVAPTVQIDVRALPGLGALTLAGLAPTVAVSNHQTVTPGIGEIVLAGLAPAATTTAHVTVTPGVGALTLAGLAPTAAGGAGLTLTPGTGALSLAGLAPTVLLPQTVTPGVGQFALAGLAPSVLLPKTVTPGVGALTIAGLAPTVAVSDNRTVAPDVGSVTLAGLAPTVATTAHVTVTPGVGALTLTGLEPTAGAGNQVTVTPGVGALLLAGHAPTVSFAPAANIVLDGLVLSGYGGATNGSAPAWTVAVRSGHIWRGTS